MSYKIEDRISTLLFDMDGTLVNTEPVGPLTFLNQLAKYSVQPSKDDYDFFVKVWRRDGTDVKEDDFLTQIVEDYNIDAAPENYIREFFALYEENILKAEALVGVNEFLIAASQSNKYKLAVVTASKASQVQVILKHRGWEDIFDEIISEEDITQHKPNPEPFLLGLQKLNAQAADTIVFEDSKNGANAGAAAGCFVVGLRAGNKIEQDLSSANIILGSFADIEI